MMDDRVGGRCPLLVDGVIDLGLARVGSEVVGGPDDRDAVRGEPRDQVRVDGGVVEPEPLGPVQVQEFDVVERH